MGSDEKLQIARSQLEHEIQWANLCRRHRKVERLFCAAGMMFVGSIIKMAYWPPSSEGYIFLYICIFLMLLAALTAMLPLLLYYAWKEWRGYRKTAEIIRHPSARTSSTRAERWKLLRDFFREERP